MARWGDDDEPKASPKLAEIFHPWPITALGTAAMLVVFWFDTSTVEYFGGSQLGGLHTSGMFVCTSPLLAGLCLLYGMTFAWLARRYHVGLAWLLVFGVSWYLLERTIPASLPRARLQRLLGPIATSGVGEFQLRIHDSFGDGQRKQGVLEGDAGVMEAIVEYRSLKPAALDRERFEMLTRTATGAAPEFPEVLEGYRDERGMFWHDASTERSIFMSTTKQRPGSRTGGRW